MEISRKELKTAAKGSLKGRWGGPIGITAILFAFFILTGAIGQANKDFSIIGSLISIFLTGAFNFGVCCYYLLFVKNTEKPEISLIFKGFNYYLKTLGMYLWMMLWVILWALLLVVPGIIKSIAYSQSFYIIAENPSVQVKDALKVSMKMTDGHKGEIFVLYLSFFGWMLLCILTLGIGFLWLVPYMTATLTNLYLKLKEISLAKGVCTAADFSGAAQG
jgi:uncharacterized membrane protein